MYGIKQSVFRSQHMANDVSTTVSVAIAASGTSQPSTIDAM